MSRVARGQDAWREHPVAAMLGAAAAAFLATLLIPAIMTIWWTFTLALGVGLVGLARQRAR